MRSLALTGYNLAINSHFMFILNLIQWRREPSLHLQPGIFNLLTRKPSQRFLEKSKFTFFSEFGQFYKYLKFGVKFIKSIFNFFPIVSKRPVLFAKYQMKKLHSSCNFYYYCKVYYLTLFL